VAKALHSIIHGNATPKEADDMFQELKHSK
jgi:hypothetical protein